MIASVLKRRLAVYLLEKYHVVVEFEYESSVTVPNFGGPERPQEKNRKALWLRCVCMTTRISHSLQDVVKDQPSLMRTLLLREPGSPNP